MTPEERREALLAERPDAEVMLADERRRTAEEIKRRVTNEPGYGTDINSYELLRAADVLRICDEVGAEHE